MISVYETSLRMKFALTRINDTLMVLLLYTSEIKKNNLTANNNF